MRTGLSHTTIVEAGIFSIWAMWATTDLERLELKNMSGVSDEQEAQRLKHEEILVSDAMQVINPKGT